MSYLKSFFSRPSALPLGLTAGPSFPFFFLSFNLFFVLVFSTVLQHTIEFVLVNHYFPVNARHPFRFSMSKLGWTIGPKKGNAHQQT